MARRTYFSQKVAVLSALLVKNAEGMPTPAGECMPTPAYRHSGLHWVTFHERAAELEHAGYVKCGKDGNRLVAIEITEAGFAMFSEAKRVMKSLGMD